MNEGIKYEGDFKRDKFDGNGVLTYLKDNIILEGTFEEGKFINGKILLGNVLYEGQIKDNHLNGKGVLVFKNNVQIEATFVNNKIQKDKPIMFIDLETGEELRVPILRNKKNYLKDERGKTYAIDYQKGFLKVVK